MDSYHRQIPIISSEWGYSSIWRGMNEEKQGEMLAREMLTNIANDIPISIWYDWHDDGVDPNEPEHHFGLVSNSYQNGRDEVLQPKPAYLIAKNLSEQFDGYTYQRRVSLGNDSDYVLEFTNGGKSRIAAWTTLSGPHSVVIPITEGRFRITKHTGESAGSVDSGPKGLELTISSAPLYLTRRAP